MSLPSISSAAQRAAPILVPTGALSIALAVLGALTPVPLNAHPHPDQTGAHVNAYVNTQFVDTQAQRHIQGEERGHLVIRNTSILPRTVYARFELPGDPGNRNNGFVRTVPPLSTITYALPLGVRVFACDGKYWDDYRPDEAFAVTIREADTYTFTTRQFKPAALRRARGE
ncbi:MAG: hypothetical protein AAF559_06355 [Pseudomonadota bacterium]